MVVVGQATQKRKRPKVSADVIDASPGKKTKEKIKITNGVEAKDEDGEAFRFSASFMITPIRAIRRRRRRNLCFCLFEQVFNGSESQIELENTFHNILHSLRNTPWKDFAGR